MQTGATLNSDVIMFEADVSTCVALFLTNIILLKHLIKNLSPKFAKKALICNSENINRVSH